MKFLFDYFPIICFFVAYKFWGIYIATAAAMVVSALQVAIYWIRFRRFEKFHVITLIFILLLGSFTLVFHNAIFIKWKPTIVYWIFAIVLFGSHFFGKHTLVHRMLKEKIELPAKTWSRLNLSWALFFLILGVLNLFVVYNFDTNTWVNFKLFGTLALMLVFILGQAFYIARHAQNLKTNSR
ncbi:septation protein A [Coxiella burnetii]|uniref:Inner membrane-spanning protein YciB n=2 Tax=Coxiella burnetii TaxID=777 RepID=YCIB_COXBN|nr:septation protein A [Coxiella burnetii]A9KG14.1 RecName: Full=Inner membrane-spanning protein YciB [Coxiella burnetii Dugway 5J108-111]B6J6X5.1 RecName: Full=Inner membrane-spanning protein YciB [Coxiella burnetii CbuK_Q154]ABS78241.1 intracellular septation protein [Coxiella burnetii Dugway 5J108-111]ACJ20024.1 intracellular septation protein [Coxiella burnetii CbuK_Q154]AIT63054.1 Intracellular septation protein A [Coxiella burnetii str. Namibia]ATN85475.1 septation protein A [Coxiella b